MKVLFIGGGICGLGAALLLARDGHEVVVLERDPEPLPDSTPVAWDAWSRGGVAQFRQPHNLMPGLRPLLESELPDIQESLRAAGATRFDLLNPLPPFLTDRSPRPTDDRLWCYSARRPVAEWVFARAAEEEPRIDLRRGSRVAELLTGPAAISGTPHVAGVRTTAGESIHADLVVDASGRQSRSPAWLAAIGAKTPYEEDADCGFVYYSRFFGGTMPERRAPTLTHLPTHSLLTLPADNGTWSVTVFCTMGDTALKALRGEAQWTNVIRAHPLHAHWLEGEPLTGVMPMAGIVDRYRRFVLDGAPVATGLVALADAWACTNPSAGRGVTVGLLHARLLRDVLRDAEGNPIDIVQLFDARTEDRIAPWYHAQVAVDRARFDEIEARRAGRDPEPPQNELARTILALLSVMPASPDLFRAAMEYIGTITPVQEIVRRPDVAHGMRAAADAMKGMPPPRMPGPDRQQLLQLLG